MSLHQRSPRLVLGSSACAIALLTLGACGDTDSDVVPSETSPAVSSPSSPTSSAPESPEPTESSEPTAPRLIDYAADGSLGVEVQDRADVEKLDGAPEAFKEFIARTAEGLGEAATCDAAAIGVRVKTLRTDGYAVGSVSDCGGYVAMWAVVDGEWKEIQGTQDFWRCGILERYSVPSDVAGPDCYDAETKDITDYSQA